jgi:predicted dehydrogenase
VTAPLRIALLGAGWIAERHATAVRETAGAQLVAAASWREPSLRALAERHSIPHTTLRWEEVASAPDVDAVVIGTPNALHAPQAIACLRAGKHVLVEKPMTTSSAEAARMVAAADASPARLMVAHCWRFHPDVQALRERIAAGRLGEIVKTRGYGAHAGWGPDGWFTDPSLAGGGALADMGVHAIDTARFLLGDPRPERVCAAIGARYAAGRVDDDAILLIGWSNGTNSIVEAGWWQPHLGGLEADTEVYGTRGYARVWQPPAGMVEDDDHCPQSMYTTQMEAFVQAISEERQPRPDARDGAVVVDVVERAYRSAAEAR